MQTILKVIETEKDLQRYFYSLQFYLVINGIHKKTGIRIVVLSLLIQRTNFEYKSNVLDSHEGMGFVSSLRRNLKKAGASFNVVKMSLAKRAASNVGFDDILDYFSGPTAVTVIESDPVEAAKVLKEFSSDNESFVVKGGLMDQLV